MKSELFIVVGVGNARDMSAFNTLASYAVNRASCFDVDKSAPSGTCGGSIFIERQRSATNEHEHLLARGR